MDALDADIRAAFKDIPKPRRVITSHEAFTYYGDAYDIQFLAAHGVGGQAQPSARSIPQLILQIKRESISQALASPASKYGNYDTSLNWVRG